MPIVRLVILEQFLKADLPISVTLSGMITSVKLVQPENALSLIVVMLLPIVMFVKSVQLEKASLLIVLTLSPIITSLRLVMLRRGTILQLIFRFSILLQPSKGVL